MSVKIPGLMTLVNDMCSIHPDGFGVEQARERPHPFFLELERRALNPSTMSARLAPYLR